MTRINLKEDLKAMWPIFVFVISTPLMSLFNRPFPDPFPDVRSLVTSFDEAMPLIEWYFLIYHSWLLCLLIAGIYFYYKNEEIFREYCFSLMLGQGMAFLTFPFFQTMVPRPYELLSGREDFLAKIINITWSYDNHFCGFPSIHVLTSSILIFYLIRGYRKNYFSPALTAILSLHMANIILSTMFTKQHVIFDVIGGICYAITASKIVIYLRRKAADKKAELKARV